MLIWLLLLSMGSRFNEAERSTYTTSNSPSRRLLSIGFIPNSIPFAPPCTRTPWEGVFAFGNQQSLSTEHQRPVFDPEHAKEPTAVLTASSRIDIARASSVYRTKDASLAYLTGMGQRYQALILCPSFTFNMLRFRMNTIQDSELAVSEARNLPYDND